MHFDKNDSSVGFNDEELEVPLAKWPILQLTRKSIDFERHRTVSEKRMLLRVELDPSSYYPARWNLFNELIKSYMDFFIGII